MLAGGASQLIPSAKRTVAVVFQYARCPVCRRRPDRIEETEAPGLLDAALMVSCHGSRDTIHVPPEALTNDSALIDYLVPRLSTLFAFDAHPDIAELIRYNRRERAWS